MPIVYGFRKTWYTITYLVITRENFVDITYLKPFYYDPGLRRKRGKLNFGPSNKVWLVKWLIDEPPGGTWENREALNDVEAFHHYCAA